MVDSMWLCLSFFYGIIAILIVETIIRLLIQLQSIFIVFVKVLNKYNKLKTEVTGRKIEGSDDFDDLDSEEQYY